MRTLLLSSSAALALAACASSPGPGASAPVEVKATGTPGQAAAARAQKLRATVRSVDGAARAVTIQDEKGETETIHLGPEVKRFDEIAPGDVVEVELEQGLLLEYQPAGSETIAPRVVVATERAPSGGAPGAAAAGGVQATVTVTAIDLPRRVVAFQGPGGKAYQVKAGPGIPLEKLKVGDRLLATYLEATAVRREKAGTKR
jgi:hypothetical protein